MISIGLEEDWDENMPLELVTTKLPVWLLGSRSCPCARLRKCFRSSVWMAWMVPDRSVLPSTRLALKRA